MKAGWHHFLVSLRLNARNPMALIYGYAFPLIFLAAFWVLYRHEPIPLLHHVGELLTVSVLGGACFGLPTALVSERERGVWRRYRLTPVPTWTLIASTALTRYLLVLSAGLLQLGIAFALGMTMPTHPFALWIAFTCAAFSFIGLGLVIAMLADSVPAVQALGQCLFLPILIIGGVAVPLAVLPEWAQTLSLFLPGRYAVHAIQSTVTGQGLPEIGFSLLALLALGLTGAITSALLFRWDAGQRFLQSGRRAGLALVAASWIAVGLFAQSRQLEAPSPTNAPSPAAPTPIVYDSAATPVNEATPAPVIEPPAPPPREPWQLLTRADTDALDYDVSPDDSVVTPFANPEDDLPPDYLLAELDALQAKLPTWAPGQDPNTLRAVRYLLCIPATADVLQLPTESLIPPIVFDYMQTRFAKEELIQALTWIAMNPGDGDVLTRLPELNLPGPVGSPRQLRERMGGYAVKFVGRLTGRLGADQSSSPDSP